MRATKIRVVKVKATKTLTMNLQRPKRGATYRVRMTYKIDKTTFVQSKLIKLKATKKKRR